MNSEIKKRREDISQGIVPEGYKETTIGIIPEEWEVKKLGETLDVRDGTHDSPKYIKDGIPFITSKNLVDGKIDWDNISYISRKDHKKFSQRSFVEDGDILFGMIGTIGNPLIVDKKFEFSIKNVALLKFNNFNINNKYILGILESDIIYRQFFRKSNAGVQKFIGLNMIRSLETPIPPLQEQEKIADILSTWDKSIETIEKLIKEKEIQKKGLMQELLTGARRLPGFSGEWEEVKLGDIVKYKNGLSNEKNVSIVGKYKLITLNSLDIKGKLKDNHSRVDTAEWFLEKDDIVMVLSDIATGNFLGLTDIIPENNMYVLNQRMGLLRVNNNSLAKYVSRFINSNQKYFKIMGQGTSQKNLSKPDVLKFKLNLPPLPEQKAIAEILSTADKEIELLNELLENKKEEKKGLMQLLLTGIVRV